MRFTEIAAFWLLGAAWGSAFTFIEIAVKVFPPFTLVFLRLLVACFPMYGLIFFMVRKDPDLKERMRNDMTAVTLMQLCFMGLFNNFIPFVLVAYSEREINSGLASILDSTIPLFSVILTPIMLRGDQRASEGINKWKIAGVSIGFLGVIVICMRRVIEGDKPLTWTHFGAYMGVTLAAASYGLSSVYAKRYLVGKEPYLTAAGQITTGMILCLIFSITVDAMYPPSGYASRFGFLANLSFMSLVSIAYLGLISTFLAYQLYFFLIRTIGSVKQTLVGYLLPFFGVTEGVLFLGEWANVDWYYIIVELMGAALILAGIFFVNAGPKPEATAVPTSEEGAAKKEAAADARSGLLENGKATEYNSINQ